MKIHRYKNGNITIQREPKEELSLEEQNLLVAIAWNVPDMDLLGDPGCFGNFDMYQFFYNYYTDKKYMVLFREQEDWENGRLIRLFATNLDQDDREWLRRKEENVY